MPNPVSFAKNSSALTHYIANNPCDPESNRTDLEGLSDSNAGSMDEIQYERTDYPESDSMALRNIRDEGYGLIFDLVHATETANNKLIAAQWDAFDHALYEFEIGDSSAAELHTLPDDIQFFGDSYGSLADKLQKLLTVVNTPDSPFFVQLPRLAKASDHIPDTARKRLNQHPDIKQTIERQLEHNKMERMLDVPLSKLGAKNPLTTAKLDDLISRLDQFFSTAKTLDEFHENRVDQYHQRDTVVYHLEDLEANLQVVKQKLRHCLSEEAQSTLEMVNHGGKV